MSLKRRPVLADLPCVWGEELAITITLNEAGVPSDGITALSVVITDIAGVDVMSTATTDEESEGVWSAYWTATQMRDDIAPGTWAYVITPSVDGKPQSVVAGQLKVARPAIAGVVT